MTKTEATGLLLTALIMCWLMAGCASMFSAKTEMQYQIAPDGTRNISYSSGKDIGGIDASWEETPDGKGKIVHLKVDKSATSESAIAAALQLQVEMAKIVEQLLPLAAAAAKTAK